MSTEVEVCSNCSRNVFAMNQSRGKYHGRVVRATVKHDYYGCDSGCCGHRVYGYDERGNEACSRFEFDHPDKSGDVAWARQFVAAVFGNPDILQVEDSDIRDD